MPFVPLLVERVVLFFDLLVQLCMYSRFSTNLNKIHEFCINLLICSFCHFWPLFSLRSMFREDIEPASIGCYPVSSKMSLRLCCD
uniref:Uncharacterized protein n=1 Tax=Pararge aegeria TaxID=116150 RepID=S4PJ96_9NEOP